MFVLEWSVGPNAVLVAVMLLVELHSMRFVSSDLYDADERNVMLMRE